MCARVCSTDARTFNFTFAVVKRIQTDGRRDVGLFTRLLHMKLYIACIINPIENLIKRHIVYIPDF